MERRWFLHSATLGTAGLALSDFRNHQEAVVRYHFWDVAARLAETVQSLIVEEVRGGGELVQALIDSSLAALAGLREDASEAFTLAESLGSDLWGELDQLAESIGVPEFEEYRRGTMAWLANALQEWSSSDTLPAFEVNREAVQCFFRELRNQSDCVKAPASTLVTCALVGLLGLPGGAPGFLAVFGICLRRRAPGLVVHLALNCVRPSAERCFGA